jgi:hypothetical protein
MKRMGRYCKAYPIERFREFPGWKEDPRGLRREEATEAVGEAGAERQLGDGDFLYLQEDLTVTDGVFLGENVVYGDVTPEWAEFCRDSLKFEIPPECAEQPAPEGAAAEGAAAHS